MSTANYRDVHLCQSRISPCVCRFNGCTKTTTITPYCPLHLHRYGLEVKQSQLEGAGLGLFARIDIPRGTPIDAYTGTIVTQREANQLERQGANMSYQLQQYHNKKSDIIMGNNLTDSASRFVNTLTEAQHNRYRVDYNTAFIGFTRKPIHVQSNIFYYPLLVTTENVKANQEIFVYYSDEYNASINADVHMPNYQTQDYIDTVLSKTNNIRKLYKEYLEGLVRKRIIPFKIPRLPTIDLVEANRIRLAALAAERARNTIDLTGDGIRKNNRKRKRISGGSVTFLS